jgi:hypothetical protein
MSETSVSAPAAGLILGIGIAMLCGPAMLLILLAVTFFWLFWE